MGYAHEYAHAVLHRGRVPMEPTDHVVDWADGPRKGKFYPDAPVFALPGTEDLADVPVAPGLLPDSVPARDADRAPGFTLPLLSAMLRDSYGLTGRRLGVQANTDLAGLPFHTHANWSRGTAGGGGLYPMGIHWASGPSAPLTPGLHHYDVQRHALQRLLTGDVTDRVRDALGADAPADALDADQYLILSVKYWQNSFKYNSFSFHVVCTDLGTLVQTWRLWAAPRGGRPARPAARRRRRTGAHGPRAPARRAAPRLRTLPHPPRLRRPARHAHRDPGGRRGPARPRRAGRCRRPHRASPGGHRAARPPARTGPAGHRCPPGAARTAVQLRPVRRPAPRRARGAVRRAGGLRADP